MSDYEYLFKFIMIGDSNVGKSCLLMRLLEGRFKNQHEPTLGVQFGSKVFSIKDTLIKLQVWDTAGQQSFKSITRAYYKGSIAAILVYDITSQTSFNNLENWLYELKNHSHQKLHIALVGNKVDQAKERQVSQERALSFAKKHGIEYYYETSALTGVNVEKPFFQLGVQVMNKIQNGLINPDMDTAYGVKRGRGHKKNIILEKGEKGEKAIGFGRDENTQNSKCNC